MRTSSVAHTTRQYDGDPEARATILRSRSVGGDPLGLIGPKCRAASWDEADQAIRAAWPRACSHGAMIVWHWALPERRDLDDVVGEAWPVRGSRTEWWYRVLTSTIPVSPVDL